MSLCSYCGLSFSGSGGLCPHHTLVEDSEWAVENRIMCDFIHRGIVVSRPREHVHEFDDLEMAA